MMANTSHIAGIPTWRYLYNASIPNINPPIANVANVSFGAYHSSEIGLVFSTYPQLGATAQEYALSNYMRGAWASFARNPAAGPGWNALGTFGGTDLGLLGTNGTGGVVVINPNEVDERCRILEPLYPFLDGS